MLLGGRDVTRQPEYVRSRTVGRVFQDPRAGTAPDMTIEENLAISLLRAKRSGLRMGVTNKRRAVMREQLSRLGMGLEDRLKSGVSKLSGGQRQAMSLLMATIAEPSLLLLDEHTAALDPKVAATIMELTGEIVAERHLTTLMVTHNMELALRYGDRLIMMHAGRIVLDLSSEQKATLKVERPHREVPRGRRRGVRRRPAPPRRLTLGGAGGAHGSVRDGRVPVHGDSALSRLAAIASSRSS